MNIPDISIYDRYIICIWKSSHKYYSWKACWNGWPELTDCVSYIDTKYTSHADALIAAREFIDDN